MVRIGQCGLAVLYVLYVVRSHTLEGRTGVVSHVASLDAELRLRESRVSEVLERGIGKARRIAGILHREPVPVRVMLRLRENPLRSGILRLTRNH